MTSRERELRGLRRQIEALRETAKEMGEMGLAQSLGGVIRQSIEPQIEQEATRERDAIAGR